jgi:hypothetical protein
MPEWPKGAVCKIAGVGLQRFESSSRHPHPFFSSLTTLGDAVEEKNGP